MMTWIGNILGILFLVGLVKAWISMAGYINSANCETRGIRANAKGCIEEMPSQEPMRELSSRERDIILGLKRP